MKQNVMKRTMAGVLAVLTVAAYMPANVGGFLTESTGIVMGVSAEGATVSTAEDLEDAVKAGGAFQLTENITLTKTLNVTEDVTIDLNGHSITADGCRAFHVQSGTLTLSGTGTVSSTHTDGDNFDESSSVIRVGSGNGKEVKSGNTAAGLYVGKNVTISTAWCYGISVFGSDTDETVNIYGKVNVTDTKSAVSGNGYAGYAGAIINIYDGAVLTSTNGIAIYHPQDGTLNIKGGTVSGKTAVFARAGIVNIEDGQFTGSGAVADPGTVANGADATGDAIVAHAFVDDYVTVPQFNISGGTFTSENANAIGVYKRYEQNPLPTVSVTGGTFSTDVSAYVAEGYAQNPDGTVVVAQIVNEQTLIDAVNNGGTIKLDGDIALTKTLNITSDVTIDLNGYNITATDARAFHVQSGTLTLSGTGTVSSEHTADNTSFTSSSSVIRVGNGSAKTKDGSTPAGLYVGKNVTISTAWCYGVTVFGSSTTETVDVYGTVSVTGEECAVSGNGNPQNSGTTINIYPDAVVSAANDVAIYHPQAGTLNITGGRIEGLGGIEAKAGTAAISIKGSDTSIIATAEKTSHKANGNGTSTRGYAIAAVENAGYAGSPQINVSGGNIVGPVELVKDNAVADEKKGAISITGGTFSTDVSAYVAEGYYLIDNAPNYTVKKDERVDLSKAKIVVNDGKAYSIGSTTINVIDDIKVTIGDKELVKDEDYRIYEGDTSANDVGTYVFKIEGLGNYKGTATANWTITSALEITVYGYKSETSAYYKPCQYGKSVTVTPPEGFVWDKTCYWEVETGVNQWEIVSYSQNYSFIALKNATLRINKSAEEASEKSALTMSTSQAKYSGKDAIKFTFNRSIDDKYTVKEVGILYGTNKLVGANTSISDYAYRDFTNNDTGADYGVPDLAEALKTRSTVKKGVASSKSKNGTYEFSYALGTNHLAYANAIGYVKVYDPSTKKDKILYTNVVADCYDSALYSNN